MKVEMFFAILYFIGSLLSLINAVLYGSCIWAIVALLMAHSGYKGVKRFKEKKEEKRKAQESGRMK